MRALQLTAPDGAVVSLNPLQVVGWASAPVTASSAAGAVTIMGSAVILAGGVEPRPVTEDRQTIDRLWAEAVAISGRPPTMQRSSDDTPE